MKHKSQPTDKGSNCGCRTPTGDGMEPKEGRRWFDQDATAWLVGAAIRHVHAEDEQGQLGYKRAVELLSQSDAATKTIAHLLRSVTAEDVCLRWSLLYLLSEIGDARSADVFTQVACEAIEPRERDRRACESARDGEVLVRTMAVEGLAKVSAAHKQGVDRLFKVLEAQPEAALKIEAVKGILAIAPEEGDRVKRTLPESLHFALSVKRVPAETLAVEFDLQSTADTVRAMPILGETKVAPNARCSCC